jgi:AmmeMemoRadiSam system protein B
MSRKLILIFIAFIAYSYFVFLTVKKPTTPELTDKKVEYLESYFKNLDDYNESFTKFEKTNKLPINVVITSHHFLARDVIAQTLSSVDPKRIEKVIIIAPDHFQKLSNTKYLAQTVDNDWTTPFGIMKADKDLIKNISKEKEVYFDINTFRSEHGIYTLVPFAKKLFPNATITPFVLKASSDFDKFYDLGKHILGLVDFNKTLLIVSSDFSHEASTQEASENDKKSISALQTIDIKKVNQIENDCRQCIALTYGYMGENNTFAVVRNTNSYDVSGHSPESVTSYVSGYYKKSN